MDAENVWRLEEVQPGKPGQPQQDERVRRYDRRPATVNIDRSTRLVSTRPPPRRRKLSWIVGFVSALIAGAVAISLGILIVLGVDSGADPEALNDGASSVEAPEVSARSGTIESPATTEVLTVTEATSRQAPAGPSLQESVAEFDVGRISFVAGTTQLTTQGAEGVNALATLLVASPEEPVEIVVRTFSESTPGLNHGLSIQQADALVAELVRAGVDEQRLGSVGLGSSGSEAPSASSAIKFKATNSQQVKLVTSHGPIVLTEPFSGTFTPETSTFLASLGESLAAQPTSSISLVGYAWHHDTQDQNHHESHHVLDAAFLEMQNSGVRSDQVSLVGLGGVDTTLAKQPTGVTVQTGAIATIGLALAETDVDGVGFIPSTATLSAVGEQSLVDVAEIMVLDGSVRVEVAVHTYSEPSSQENHDLSRLQADTIFKFLVDRGVAPSQLEIVWHGDPHHFAAPGRIGAVTFTVAR